ncbi:hypothetical protein pipiens_001046 [Culex pipiens pipiens]|uniref:Methyltransferase type 11 domain-containing protein n=1 Tax=Culex pipiens pipiens TaxID=38569 RepID=A0ABD1D9Z9_CULPP
MGTLTSSSSPATVTTTITNFHHPVPKTAKICSTSGSHEEETSEIRTTAPVAAPTTTAAPTATATSTLERNSRTDATGRSAALEHAYVHDVYEHCEDPVGQVRPKVAQFLAALDPGSVVCDVGCGSGRYLSGFNPMICTIGVDRCFRLAKVAREKGAEVAICDNLELPFRDESFDAVLSLAVVHHFATTERRVGAIRELARILRIGGRVIITVWAMEQRHRRFESQDVLIPWQPPRSKNAAASDEDDDDDFLPPYHAYTEDSTNSSRSAGDGDSSSLSSSSPGETCYSFVRRAIQKLAGSKKSPWFLESWSSRETKHDSSLDYEDAKDLPIELRRLEDFDDLPEPPLSAGLKSRSLDYKLCESAQAYREHITRNESRIQLLRKQSSLNEELMAESRLREKDRIRKRIQKQMSLNESFLCRSLFTKRLAVIKEGFTTKLKTSTGSLERVTKNGFVKIMQNIKATAQAHHSHNYAQNRSYDSYPPGYAPYGPDGRPGSHHLSRNNSMNNGSNGSDKLNGMGTSQDDSKPRRHSRESGSDSSKDSSLQSDTSIESEDSFASVIFIPKPEQQQQTQMLSNNGGGDGFGAGPCRMPSGPTSPMVMPCPTPAHSPAPPRTKPGFTSETNGCSSSGLNGAASELSQFTFDDTSVLPKLDEVSPIVTSSSFVNSAPSSSIKNLKSPPSNASACSSSTTASSSKPSSAIPATIAATTTTARSSPPVQKITRQQIKDLPPIPKFRKSGNYPILRRQSSTSSAAAAPVVPKLLSLELFNPETDDLDSDSSEPSSPDSIDSVISALRPSVSPQPAATAANAASQPTTQPSTIPPLVEAAAVVAHKLEDAVGLVLRESEFKSTKLPNGVPPSASSTNDTDLDDTSCRQHLVDFAEKLSAQLLKELDSEKQRCESSFDEDDDVFSEGKLKQKTLTLSDAHPITDPYLKKLNGDLRDLNQLRAELRERRLMLANLSHLGCSSGLGGSNDSLGPISYGSSMTPIIQEEGSDDDEDEDDEQQQLHESCEMEHEDFDGFYGLRGNMKNLSKNDEFVIIPELDEEDTEMASDTALLIQEEDSSEEHPQNTDVDLLGNMPVLTTLPAEPSNSKQKMVGTAAANKSSIESHASVESWAHSNSSASLDSPSAGGAATHHRYYHVFREGELDALINHHVTSLHIVSSYYERASWCVVAEKVQVWTI